MGGPPATLMSALWPSGTNDRLIVPAGAPGPPGAAVGAGMPPDSEGMDDAPPMEALSMSAGGGMSVAELGLPGRRGRDVLDPPPGAGVPLPIPSMFCARKIV